DTEDHSDQGDVLKHAIAGIPDHEPLQQDDVGVAIDDRIVERPEARLGPAHARHLAVEHVEQTRENHDQGAARELALTEVPRRPEADHDPREGEEVGLDVEEDQHADDAIQDELASQADRAADHGSNLVRFQNEVNTRGLVSTRTAAASRCGGHGAPESEGSEYEMINDK